MSHTILKKHEVSLLREEIEILMRERQSLLNTVRCSCTICCKPGQQYVIQRDLQYSKNIDKIAESIKR